MRRRLKEAGKSGRHRYRARVEKLGIHDKSKVLLTKITCEGREVAGHMWILRDEQLGRVHAGNIIEFDADVELYTKGYQGTNKKLIKKVPLEDDYKLTNISDVVKIITKNTKVKGENNGRKKDVS